MSVRSSLAWAYASQAFTFVVVFGSSVIVARLLSPHQLGVFAIAMATAAILSVFTSFNIQTYIVREGAIAIPLLRSIYSVNAIMGLSLAAITFCVGVLEKEFFNEGDVAAVLVILSFVPIFGIFEFIPIALYQREMNYAILSKINIAKSIVGAATVVGCAYAGLGSLSPAVGLLVAGLCSMTCYNILRRRDAIFIPTTRGLKPIVIFGLQLMSIGGVAQLAQRSTDIIVGRMLGLTALGLYSRASNLSGMIFSNIYGAATGVIFVKLARDLRDEGVVHETFLKSIRMITSVMWPIELGIAVLSRPMIHILYGDRWMGAALPLSFLMMAQFIVLGFGMNWELFVLRGETARQTRYEAFRAVTTLALVTVGCFFSISGAAAARIGEAMVGYLLYRPHMDRLAGTQPGELERTFGESLLLTAVAVVPSVALMVLNRWAADTPPLELALAISAGIGGWLFVLLIRRHPILTELSLALSSGRNNENELTQSPKF